MNSFNVKTPDDWKEKLFAKTTDKKSVRMAKKNDIVVLCGRGHETMQEINGVKHHFDEREVLQEVFAELKAKSGNKKDDTNNEQQ